MERIGIYGGSFNPPHIGHIQAAKEAAEALSLTKLLVIPAGLAPHKQMPGNSATPQQRLDMLRLALADCPQIEVSDLELKREGPSYTYETILQLREEYPDATLILFMGTDMFLSIHTWKNADIILNNATLGVFYRGDRGEAQAIEAKKAELEQQGVKIELVQNVAIPISSTQMRRLLAFRCAADFLPEGVLDYIREHRLYDTRADWKNLPMDKLEQVVISLLKPNRVADVTDAARAGILHDITKAIDGPLQLTLCEAYGKILSDFSRRYPKTLHALTGSLVAQRIFGENKCVVSAIEHHTTGKANMNLLEKIIYVADYMEPNRDFPGVEKLRELAFSDIDAALKLGLEMTLEHLKRQGAEVSPASREALAWFEKQ